MKEVRHTYLPGAEKPPRSIYLLQSMAEYCLGGNIYIKREELFKQCLRNHMVESRSQFEEDVEEQVALGNLRAEGEDIYLNEEWRYEQYAAKALAGLLRENALAPFQSTSAKSLMDTGHLCQEQVDAVEMALSNRVSLILGGAGRGKTSLIEALGYDVSGGELMVCTPTGKAAKNITDKTGILASTIHSAAGVTPDDSFLDGLRWEGVRMIVVDEVSMVSTGMLAGLLCRMDRDCQMVLLGDPHQLLSVGAGNVLPDLLELGFPSITLKVNHRTDDHAKALLHNVTDFDHIRFFRDLEFDDSFQMVALPPGQVHDRIVRDAAKLYLAGADVQVLSPVNKSTDCSVDALNRGIRKVVNPGGKGKESVKTRFGTFRDGDRILITENDYYRGCFNGDIGTLHIRRIPHEDKEDELLLTVALPDGRRPTWQSTEPLTSLRLAYCVTVHKMQGSECDIVLLPMLDAFSLSLRRNMLYTAISRARKQVILYGRKNAVSIAVQRNPEPRRSKLVEKTCAYLADVLASKKYAS